MQHTFLCLYILQMNCRNRVPYFSYLYIIASFLDPILSDANAVRPSHYSCARYVSVTDGRKLTKTVNYIIHTMGAFDRRNYKWHDLKITHKKKREMDEIFPCKAMNKYIQVQLFSGSGYLFQLVRNQTTGL